MEKKASNLNRFMKVNELHDSHEESHRKFGFTVYLHTYHNIQQGVFLIYLNLIKTILICINLNLFQYH